MTDKKNEIIEVKLKDIDKVNFESKKLRKEFESVKQRNEELIESTKVDTDSLSNRFEGMNNVKKK